MNIDYFSYDELMTYYIDGYFRLFGKLKMQQVAEKIRDSKKVSDLIRQSIERKYMPTKRDFEEYISGILFFTFAKPETHTLGVLFALQRWNNEVNGKVITVNESLLENVARQIILTSNTDMSYVLSHANREI